MKHEGDKYGFYLVKILKEEVSSRDSEMAALRSSLRYRVGGWVLEAWPPSYRTLVIMARMVVAFIRLKRRGSSSRATVPRSLTVPEQTESFTNVVVFGTQVPDPFKVEGTVCFDDPAALIALLDTEQPAGTLVLRVADQAAIRRVQRLRLNGWRVVWWPEESSGVGEPSLACYLSAHADECRGGARS